VGVRSRREIIKLILGVLCFGLAACSPFAPLVPKDGPTADAIRSSAEAATPAPASIPYALVHLDDGIIEVLNAATGVVAKPSWVAPSSPGSRRVAIGVGDVIAVTVFEAQSGGLFLPTESIVRQGNFVPIPNQQVDANGLINIPFAGPIHVAGLTPEEAAKIIAKRLNNRAIEPQVVVTLAERRSSAISVIGEVGSPVRFFLDPGGIRLLEAVARAGGSKHAAFESMITLQRRGATHKILLSDALKQTSLNVGLEAGDLIEISYAPKVFMAFGSFEKIQQGSSMTRRFPFETENLTLAEGLARAGGLDPSRADPKAVFLFRMEKRDTLGRIGVDISPFAGETVPTVYAVDLSGSQGFFHMNSMLLRSLDMLVASDAPLADTEKLVGLFVMGSNIAYQVALARH